MSLRQDQVRLHKRTLDMLIRAALANGTLQELAEAIKQVDAKLDRLLRE